MGPANPHVRGLATGSRLRAEAGRNRTEADPKPKGGNTAMPVATRRELLEAGVHFGHQTRRWNPKMRRFIFGERSGIYIIDLEKTLDALNQTYEFLLEVGRKGGSVLFVGTKKQAQEIVRLIQGVESLLEV